mgnify:CR=1 FL=1|tara:strand:- start:244 stop:849 length:606 start_codon:yes stop_codon:yes gene_type:complete
MSDSNVETLGENEEKGEKSEEENVVINIEPKRKPRKKMSPEDHAAMLERLKKGREAAHAKRRALESTVKMKKIEKLQSEVDAAQNDPIIKTNKKELKENKEEDEVKDVTIIKKKKKKKVIIQESDSSSEEEIIVRRKSKSRQAPSTPTPAPPPPPAVARRPPPTAEERQMVIERAEAARMVALQVAQNKARQDQMMKNIFG